MIERFSCRDFRNLEPLEWRPEAGPQLVVGANGAGKTSLLEALYLLATGRSFRGARPAECCRRGSEAFYLVGEVAGARQARLSLGWSVAGGLDRRVNDKTASLAEHLTVQPVVAWSAADAELLDGPPGRRRRLLDQGIVAERPAALGVLSRYRQALEQKRRLLAAGAGALGPWNELLAAAAAELIRLRREHARRLQEELAGVLAGSRLGLGSVRLRYRPSPAGGAEEILAALAAARDDERRQQRPLVGPHRDDLEVLWRGSGLRRTASAGERKLLGLALTAARGRLLATAGREPLYLLDDFDGDLDRERLAGAWELFAGAAQLVATSHRPDAWERAGRRREWQLGDGRLATGEEPPETPESEI